MPNSTEFTEFSNFSLPDVKLYNFINFQIDGIMSRICTEFIIVEFLIFWYIYRRTTDLHSNIVVFNRNKKYINFKKRSCYIFKLYQLTIDLFISLLFHFISDFLSI